MSLLKGKLAVATGGGSSVIEVAQASRRSFINGHADRDVLVLGTHCSTPAVGRIVRARPLAFRRRSKPDAMNIRVDPDRERIHGAQLSKLTDASRTDKRQDPYFCQ